MEGSATLGSDASAIWGLAGESGTSEGPLFFFYQKKHLHSLQENKGDKPREFEGRALKGIRSDAAL